MTSHLTISALAERLQSLQDEVIEANGCFDAVLALNSAISALNRQAGDLEEESSYAGMREARRERRAYLERVL